MKNYFKKTTYLPFLLLLCFILIIFSGCSYGKKSAKNRFFSVSLSSNPKNLDPQTAINSNEITIIGNIFEGLYRKKLDGSFELGLAENVYIDRKKKSAIFTIKKNLCWKCNNEKCEPANTTKYDISADDFLFAFQRLIDSTTKAPFAANYFFIKNSKKINDGDLPLHRLGVSIDDNKQLVIDMDYIPPNLEELLAAVPAMPCNREFFKSTKGRYGTTATTLAFNGPFYIYSWTNTQDSKKIKLRNNKEYYDAKSVQPIGINLTPRSQQETLNMFKKQDIDIILTDEAQFEEISPKESNFKSFQNNTIGICFNEKSKIFKDENIRKAVAFDIDRDKLQNNLNFGQELSFGIIPNSVTINGEEYRKIAKDEGTVFPPYDVETAKNFLVKATEKKNIEFSAVSILINETDYATLNQILQTWQKDLGIFFKLDIQNNESYIKKLKAGNFDLAAVTLKNNFNSPFCILNNFSAGSVFNYFNIEINNYEQLLTTAQRQEDSKTLVLKYFEIEKLICNNGHFIPICHKNKYLIWNKKIQNIVFDQSNEQLYFAHLFKN